MSKRIISLLIVLVMLVASFASCGLFGGDNNDNNGGTKPGTNPGTTPGGSTGGDTTEDDDNYTVETFTGNFTYNDAVSAMSANWNPHTYQTSDESYPISFITTGLYGFVFNDEFIHKSDKGLDAYAGYKIIPEMAASLPVDVTEAVKAAHPEYNIPESATSGYAYTIDLNPNATWENGEKINADTYVYSMKMLLDPKYQNYRGSDYFAGSLSIANAENYYYQGQVSYTESDIAVADLVKGDDGNYYTTEGNPMFIAVDYAISWLASGGVSYPLTTWVGVYPEYFNLENWEALVASCNDKGVAPLNDTTLGYLVSVISTADWGEDESYAPNYFLEAVVYEDNYSFDNVGIFKSGEYQITLVLGKSLAGFNLLYNLSGNWIVYQPYYDDNMTKIEDSDAYSSTYNTSVETTMSYGPYKMTGYVMDNSMTFEKNENWFGYTDGQHVYKDPEDGLVYPMYQTTKIFCQKVSEAETRKMMFLAGQLMGYGLQSEDYEQYRDSEFCYVTPSETIFFFIFNGNMSAIKDREAAADFDQTKNDLETLTLNSFRRAVAVTFDKEALCTAVSPSRSGGYGLIGDNYIYDPETGARYRDTDQAKKALLEFYSVDLDDFDGDLDAAVNSITGYDVTTARKYYNQAFEEALDLKYITDANNDGKCDQKIEIIYASSSSSAFITKTLDYLNEKLNEVLAGTPFENMISFVESAPLGNGWSDKLKAGLADPCLAGWSGSALDPFGLTDLYTNPSYQYDAAWFDATQTTLTLTVKVDGVETDVTMNLRQWSDALNGATVKVDGVEYCFGDGIADVDTRLDILAAIETEVLKTYNYIPMLQDGGMSLLSKQVYYVVEEYNPIMGRGGIAYLKYNYEDAAWAAYVAENNGTLSY